MGYTRTMERGCSTEVRSIMQLQQIAAELYKYVQEEAPAGYPYTGGTAVGAADFWVESWYATDDHTGFPCTEADLIPTSNELVELLVALGLSRA